MKSDAALSTSWNAKRHADARGMVEEILSLGIENLEVGYLTSPRQLEELLTDLPQGRCRVVSVHNYCPVPPGHRSSWGDDDLLSSLDETKRKSGVHSTLETIEWASRLGARVVVMHLGQVQVDKAIFKTLKQSVAEGDAERAVLRAMVADARKERDEQAPRYLFAVRKTLDDILTRLPSGIVLGLECRSDYYQIPNVSEAEQLLEEYGDAVGYWHDVGHAYMQELVGFYPPGEYIRTLHHRLVGWHLHDSLRVSDHRPPGAGEIDFETLVIPYLTDNALKVVELHPRTSVDEATQGLAFLRSQNIIS